MDLSVIIPCHNLENYITPMLMSLAAQDTTNIQVEYIFVCDACDDDTANVINRFWDEANVKDIPIYILEVSLHSCGLARNVGLEQATGKYIWFMDGDDWLLSTKAIQKAYYGICYYQADVFKIKFLSEKFKIEYFSMVWQYIFKRDIIGSLRFDSISPGEDDRFTAQIYDKIDKIYGLNEPLYYYNYLREGSNMYTFFQNQQENNSKN